MLTGRNTEIVHDDVAFHVQTEDKGRDNPVIVSLIYVGGRVLAAKRTSYAGLVAQGQADANHLAELMDRQHRTMLAAIKRGRFDEHVRELFEARETPSGSARGGDGNSTLEDLGQSLDEMVSEFLGAEAPDTLELAIEAELPPSAGGVSEIVVRALLMPGSRLVVGAAVRVEMISPFEPPRLLASGLTDEEGGCRVRLALSDAMGGLAALIVTVSSPAGVAEEKILL